MSCEKGGRISALLFLFTVKKAALLSDSEYARIVKGCLRLENNPSPDGKHTKKLKVYKDLYKLRIGTYRVVFLWKGEDVTVVRVLTKQDFIKKY